MRSRPHRPTGRRRSGSGFSLVELCVVLTILLIILAIALPAGLKARKQAYEEVLREDLVTMRKAIDRFTRGKKRAPRALEELVTEGYLAEIPVDPMTGSAETWKVTEEEGDPVDIDGERGIENVKSASEEFDTSGLKQYSDY